MAIENTYWAHNGLYKETLAKLEELIPVEGPVAKPAKNKELERFRKASNCYHDLYNNGLCNRASAFSKIFGIKSSHYRTPYRTTRFTPSLYDQVEKAMNGIIEIAAAEQGIELKINSKHFSDQE